MIDWPHSLAGRALRIAEMTPDQQATLIGEAKARTHPLGAVLQDIAAYETPSMRWLRTVAGPVLDANREAWAAEDAEIEMMEGSN